MTTPIEVTGTSYAEVLDSADGSGYLTVHGADFHLIFSATEPSATSEGHLLPGNTRHRIGRPLTSGMKAWVRCVPSISTTAVVDTDASVFGS